MSVASMTLLRRFLLFDQKHDIDEVTAFLSSFRHGANLR